MSKKGLLERLQEGVVIGDGGQIFALERRGYVNAATWTPEAVVEYPDAVKQLERDFVHAGSDVVQTLTYNGSDDKLIRVFGDNQISCKELNEAACRISREVANEGGALVGGCFTKTPSYIEGKGKAEVQAQIRKQISYIKDHVDFLIAEFFSYVEEIEWAIEEALKTGKVVAANMAISEKGDRNGVPVGECAVRMAKAGAHLVGVNCLFDPDMTINTITAMKKALDAAGLKPYLMTQANGFICLKDPDDRGYLACPEFPYAMEPRKVTRFEVHRYARAAYNVGVRYIGGCCGFEPYHIRAIAEELAEERGKLPPASDKHKPWGEALRRHYSDYIKARAGREYWENLKPESGRDHYGKS